MIKIKEKDLLELIFWSRRYCDNRATYAPSTFNQLYERIVQMNPEIIQKDQFDETLYNKGQFWPYAQDGQYNPNTGAFDAMPRKHRKIKEQHDPSNRRYKNRSSTTNKTKKVTLLLEE